MIINGTYKGASVKIVDIDVTGQSIYTTYIDGSGNLKTDIDWLRPGANPVTLATSCSAVS
jgi:hypothetical protein